MNRAPFSRFHFRHELTLLSVLVKDRALSAVAAQSRVMSPRPSFPRLRFDGGYLPESRAESFAPSADGARAPRQILQSAPLPFACAAACASLGSGGVIVSQKRMKRAKVSAVKPTSRSSLCT